jgi:hypothetical protein
MCIACVGFVIIYLLEADTVATVMRLHDALIYMTHSMKIIIFL